MAKLLLLAEFECGEHDEEVDRYFKYFNRETGKWMQQVHYDLLTTGEKISFSAWKRRQDPEAFAAHGAKISAAHKGRKKSDESIAKRIAAIKGRKMSDEAIAKRIGRKRSDETRAKISAAHKGRKKSDEAKAKISAANTGRKMSDETIAKRIATRNRNRNLRNG